MNIKSVFFDLDGTLLDTALDLGAALNATLDHFDKVTLSQETIRPQVSNGANALIQLGFGTSLTDKEHKIRRQYLLDYYLQNIAQHTVAFSGIESLIEQLSEHGISWGIATNKPWLYTEALMSKMLFASKPLAIICPEHIDNKKPAPDSLHLACKKVRCLPKQMIYIGDHIRDIECAKAADCHSIAAAYGYIDTPGAAQQWQADYLVSDASEIFPIVQTINLN